VACTFADFGVLQFLFVQHKHLSS